MDKQQTIEFIAQMISTYYHYAHVEGYYTAKNKTLSEAEIQKAYDMATNNKKEFIECAKQIYEIVESHIKKDGGNNGQFVNPFQFIYGQTYGSSKRLDLPKLRSSKFTIG